MSEAPVPDRTEQDAGTALDDTIPGTSYGMVRLVALGGSAGAIEALQEFFSGIPSDCPLAFVVAIHLGTEHDSQLAELIQPRTSLRVMRLTQREPLRPGTVYVIPPRKLIRVEGDCLVVEDRLPEQKRLVAVDLLFRTLADSHGAHSAAVVLSGADGDGAIGIKRVKERGGLTVAQDPEECRHPGMPRTAIATGMVDWTLPVAEMPSRLMAYFRLEEHLRLPAEEAPEAPPSASRDAENEAALREILAFLRTRTGRDFNGYKRATVVRRIARRMQINGTDHMAGYLKFLRTRPGEAPALLQDLLISVTNFFRDADCFEALEPHLAEMLRGRPANEAVRIWVPGCATGEEAYSLAILLCDKSREMDAPPQIQVFASDLDEDAIRTAREGLYPAAIEADVSPERLRRYFSKEHRGYRVRREVREMVLFAPHDVLKDSPFSRLDLVSCRNLLIYLGRPAQQRLFQTFHFALRPQGLLFLGASENCEDGGNLFTVVDKGNRIFMQRPLPRPALLPVPTGPSTLVQALHGGMAQPTIGGRAFEPPPVGGRLPKAGEERGASWGALHLRLLETLAPPSILVDRDHEIVHLSANAGRFLQFSGGEPSRNLLRAIHPALRIELRAALYQASQSREATEVVVDRVPLPEGESTVTVRVWAVQDMGADLFLVLLDPRAGEAPEARAVQLQQKDPVATHLDRELERLKTQLRETVEQYEASTEELKAGNEELQAMNEELRSATEELETSREELQSLNEELTTVNNELKGKVDELADANSDLHNLMDATDIATVFLDRGLSVMRYTPAAVHLFNLIPSDLGRPLSDLATRLDYPELADDAQRVLDRLVPIEREVALPDGTWFLVRMVPYRTVDDRISGVVLSFIDITRRRQAEEVRTWLSAVVHASTDGIVSFALDGTILSWNAACERIFGYTAAEMIGQPLDLLAPGHEQSQLDQISKLREGASVEYETVRRRKDGREIQVSLSVSPIRDPGGSVMGGTSVVRDITDARRAQQALRESEEQLRLVVENVREYAIFSLDLERRVVSWNRGAERLLGYSEKEVVGQIGDIIFTEEDRRARAPEAEARTALEHGRASDDRVHVRKDGTPFWAEGVAMLMRDEKGRAMGFVKVLRDQTQAREAKQALERSQAELRQSLEETQLARRALEAADAAKDRFLAVLSHELRNPLASIASASELLLMPKLPESAREKAAEVVQRQGKAMKVLLDELLDVSRLTLGRLNLSKRPVSVALVVHQALEATRPLVQAAAHELVVSLPAHSVEVEGDPLRLSQVVSNLVSNAAKYTPEGGRIEVSAEVFSDEVVIQVSDNGIGMEPSQIDRMFDLFSQGESVTGHSNSGLGIGLALARNIVEMHGGWIMASSAGPGQGSQLRVGLPLLHVGDAEAAVQAEEPRMQPPSPAPAAEGELILVADDNGDAAWGLAKLLELSGFRAVLARSGEEALQVADEHRPAIALLDIGMPDISGHEVARRLRKQDWGREMILIAATGWGQEADIRHSMEAGFDAHLTKPLNVGRIRGLIEELKSKRKP
ncbi:PAS domain S-box protein [Ramlibacter henchirensis]|uniref:PAS domain S-box protein n=1 Tax=Ramlibacter henchirensis TaxID=204072 RepID=A0A4Z0C6X7_9BURK|nr:PAS domain S-box protein [Ramlibacter henchirensis]TFZ07041.1 PAS domain S-box protein [Ramlibacter henchirensis]